MRFAGVPGDVLLDVRGPVATVTFNRPDLGNAVTSDSAAALLAALVAVDSDDSVRAVVLTGSGSTFNVGAYRPRETTTVPMPQPAASGASDRYRQQIPTMRRVIELLSGSSTVSIVAVNGACAGAGLAIALAADLCYSADDAGFNTAFLSAGLPGELGAIWFATRQVGLARAHELFLLPGRSSAQRMAEIGLINGVYPPANLMPSVTEIADRIAASSPVAVRAMKANFGWALSHPLSEYLDYEQQAMIDTIAAAEGSRA